MASTLSNGTRRQNTKKSMIQPVLPVLPNLARGSKAKPAPDLFHVVERATEQTSSEAGPLGSPGNIEVTEGAQELASDGSNSLAVVEALTVDGAEAQTSDQPKESRVELEAVAVNETPLPARLVAELGDANELLAPTDASSYQDGATRSNDSAVSAEEILNVPMSVQDQSGSESQPWSDDANNTSYPTSLGAVHEPLTNGYANNSAHIQVPDSNKDALTISNDDEAEALRYENHEQFPHEASERSNASLHSHQQPGAPSQQYSLPTSGHHSRSGSLSIPQLPSIAEHLLQLSASKMWADWVFMIHANSRQPFAAYAHSLLLMRSTRLTNLMNRQVTSQYNGNVIDVHPPRAIVPHAFEAALRFFYSDTVLSREALAPKQPTSDAQGMRINLLDYLLSYWISGIELGIEPIVTRSAHLLVEFVDWDLVEALTKEAFELDSVSWRAGDQHAGVALDYAAMALQLKQTILNFCARRIKPADFKLDTNVATSVIKSRFVHVEDNRARHNPALSNLVFGSMPSSADLSPASPQSEILPTVASFEEQAASNILLNLDFDDLAFFYRQLEASHGAVAAQLIVKVVDERESRRLTVISNRSIPNKQRMTNSEVWDVAGSRETFEDGFLRRERVGFLLPMKSR